jgi:hypothetical protein
MKSKKFEVIVKNVIKVLCHVEELSTSIDEYIYEGVAVCW